MTLFKRIGRRRFLGFLGLGAATVASGAALVSRLRDEDSGDEDPARSPAADQYRNLANPIEEILNAPDDSLTFDYLIVGSGYGGAILAANLAKTFKGANIALFERGREIAPGAYPRNFKMGRSEFRKKTNPLGFLNYHFHKEVDVFVANALGGTSLINANVAIKPDGEIFTQKNWPKAIVEDHLSGKLDQYYERARFLLDAQKYTLPYPLKKAAVLEKEAKANGGAFEWLELTVHFKETGQKNNAGTTMHQCELCGDCMTGCNWGAKNSTNFNYLPIAKDNGAKIYTQLEVHSLTAYEVAGSRRYRIEFTHHALGSKGGGTRRKVSAKNVILAAGSLGSTEILLRSGGQGLSFSHRLGKGFSANGNSLGMSYNGNFQTDVLGFGLQLDRMAPGYRVGPTILGSADYRYDLSSSGKKLKANLYDRFVIEDASISSPLVGLISDFAIVDEFPTSLKKFFRSIVDIFKKRSPSGALNSSMVYLGCGHDRAEGELILNDQGDVTVSWPGVRENDPVFKKITDKMRDHARTDGGHFTVPNPREMKILGSKLATVHPLGGCSMGDDALSGVVNHKGQVFDSSGGIHEGLYVCDGAIIPGAVGVNPFLTISAMAERISDFLTWSREG